MSGHRPFNELTKDFAPERRRRIESMKAKLLADAPLNELCRAKAPAQQEPAEPLEVKQSAGGRGEMTAYERLGVSPK